MEPWQTLAIAGVALIILEIFTPSFFMLPAGIAFLFTALLSPLLPGWSFILGLLAASLLVVYGVFYRYVWPRLKKRAPKTNASGMSGKIAVVTEPVRPDGTSGYVKLYGDSWRAISDRSFEIGERVVILTTEGNKVVVGPLGEG